MNEQQAKQPVVGLADAIERAATALKYRINLIETEGLFGLISEPGQDIAILEIREWRS